MDTLQGWTPAIKPTIILRGVWIDRLPTGAGWWEKELTFPDLNNIIAANNNSICAQCYNGKHHMHSLPWHWTPSPVKPAWHTQEWLPILLIHSARVSWQLLPSALAHSLTSCSQLSPINNCVTLIDYATEAVLPPLQIMSSMSPLNSGEHQPVQILGNYHRGWSLLNSSKKFSPLKFQLCCRTWIQWLYSGISSRGPILWYLRKID